MRLRNKEIRRARKREAVQLKERIKVLQAAKTPAPARAGRAATTKRATS
jgi:hypothetical protein